jgi:TonB-dependent receptor
MQYPPFNLRRRRCSTAVSTALLLMAAPLAGAQQSAPPAAGGDIAQVLVVGTRASEQSSIARKKNAATAQDSIIADDIGSFPDRNVAEAISRISGVNLDRNDFGEGNTVSVRGNGADLTRVEVDGMAALNAGGTDGNGGGDGRGVSLSDMPAELIQSVDVVKGSTADMTEGSLGGGIIIKTRTGLDFKKRTMVVRAEAAQGSVNKKWTPKFNLVFADKFLDGRLGVVVNLVQEKQKNEAHSITQNQNESYGRTLDFDHSPEKTFSYQPDVLLTSDAATTTPGGSWPRAASAGGGNLVAFSPQEILQRSAAARTKDDCRAAFPLFTAAELTPLSTSNRAAAQNRRINELASCLNQWNDYIPFLVRNAVRRQDDERSTGDIRFDYKVNNNLTVFVKHNRNSRHLIDDLWQFTQGAPIYNGAANGVQGYVDGTGADPRTNPYITRSPVAGSGFHFYDTPTNAGSSSTYRGMTNGQVVNIDPASVKVDANHHLTEFVLSHGASNVDTLYQTIDTRGSLTTAGGSYRNGRFKADLLLGKNEAEFTRVNRRAAFGYNYGPVKFSLAPSGLWAITPVEGTVYDPTDPNNYGNVVATGAGLPLRAPYNPSSATGQLGTSLAVDPQYRESSESNAKLDMSYNLNGTVPFLGIVKFGGSRRKYESRNWGAGGLNVQTGPETTSGTPYWRVATPDGAIRSYFQACEDTPQSAGTINACKYGYYPVASTALSNTNGRDTRDSHIVLTPAAYRDLIAQSMTLQSSRFFGGAKDRPAGLIDYWTATDIPKLYGLLNIPNSDFSNCFKSCLGNDGKVYEQPASIATETVEAGYLSADFSLDRVPFTSRELPFGMTLEGNFGWRYIRTNVTGTSSTTFRVINDEGTSEIRRNASLNRSTTDILPVFNLAWWPVADTVVVRFNRAKTVARPPVSLLTGSSVTCTFDETTDPGDVGDDGDTRGDANCSGTLGNPALRARTNVNKNLSLEWYVNRDSMLSASVWKQTGIIGAAQVATLTGVRPFAGTGAVDPTGRPLDDVAFTVRTNLNREATSSEGIEVSGKTAFTFLPGVLRYTGLNANFTKIRGKVEGLQYRDLLSGVPLDPPNQQDHSWNASLWYDDGALSGRVALQVTDRYFTDIAATATYISNFAAPNVSANSIPYNPGAPRFRDARRFIDAKIAYKFKNGIEVFAEGRNIGRSTVTSSNGEFAPFADGTPSITAYTYSGARYVLGATLRY